MASNTLNVRIKLRAKTTAEWAAIASTFVPLAGEPCLDTTVNKIKIGDGATVYEDLPYYVNTAAGKDVLTDFDDYVEATNGTTTVPTSKAVVDYVSEALSAAQAMILKGTVAEADDLPTTGGEAGFTYLASASFTIGEAPDATNVNKGDLLVLTSIDDTTSEYSWTIIEAGNEITQVKATDGELQINDGDGLHGVLEIGLADLTTLDTDPLVAGVYGSDDYTTDEETAGKKVVNFGDSFKVVRAIVDNFGRITGAKTITIEVGALSETGDENTPVYVNEDGEVTAVTGLDANLLTHVNADDYLVLDGGFDLPVAP